MRKQKKTRRSNSSLKKMKRKPRRSNWNPRKKENQKKEVIKHRNKKKVKLRRKCEMYIFLFTGVNYLFPVSPETEKSKRERTNEGRKDWRARKEGYGDRPRKSSDSPFNFRKFRSKVFPLRGSEAGTYRHEHTHETTQPEREEKLQYSADWKAIAKPKNRKKQKRDKQEKLFHFFFVETKITRPGWKPMPADFSWRSS